MLMRSSMSNFILMWHCYKAVKKREYCWIFSNIIIIIITTFVIITILILIIIIRRLPLSALFALCSQIYSRAARSRLTQTFCRQRRDVTCTRSLLRSERFPSASGPDNVVPHAAAAALNFTDDLVLSPRGIYDINQYTIIITAIIIIITLVKVF